MKPESEHFIFLMKQIRGICHYQCANIAEVKMIKEETKNCYTYLASNFYDKAFFNLGFWDQRVHDEYKALDFNFSEICPVQDIYPQLLLFNLIRPLIHINFFNKRLLDIGCANGIGLKVCSQLLKTEQAVGIDLVAQSIRNANQNFHQEGNINYLQGDAEQLCFENESFDIVTNLESSHLYPRIERFFSEVERVLAPRGYFCYADFEPTTKLQSQKLEAWLKQRKNLRIVQKNDITKMIQSSLYNRIIKNEEGFCKMLSTVFGDESSGEIKYLPQLVYEFGLIYVPWWKIWFKNPALRELARLARKQSFMLKKHYFHYIIQKM